MARRMYMHAHNTILVYVCHHLMTILQWCAIHRFNGVNVELLVLK